MKNKWHGLVTVARGLILQGIAVMLVAATAYSGTYETSEDIIDGSKQGKYATTKKGSFVPVPIPMSNPTLGTGLMAALLYLHPEDETAPDAPNATSGLAGLYTDTESWFAGAFHSGSLRNGRIRMSGFTGYGELNLDFYGIGNDPDLKDDPIKYGLKSFVLSPKVLFGLFGGNNWFAGANYIYLSSSCSFDTSGTVPGVGEPEFDIRTAGVGLIGMYDSRDDNYYPTTGELMEVKVTNFAGAWGSDNAFNKFDIDLRGYRSVVPSTTIALRLRAEMSGGDVPFFALSRLEMHGFSKSRYTDLHTLSFQAEIRYNFYPRWGIVGFAEAGQYASKLKDLLTGKTIVSGGAGVRWQVVREKAMNLGMDVAVSNDESALYIQIGEHF